MFRVFCVFHIIIGLEIQDGHIWRPYTVQRICIASLNDLPVLWTVIELSRFYSSKKAYLDAFWTSFCNFHMPYNHEWMCHTLHYWAVLLSLWSWIRKRLNDLVKVTQEICDRVKNFLKANLLFSIIVFFSSSLAVFKVEVNPIFSIHLCICTD